ncbi:hypothetical protein [uncultured Mailhella sp.]|uniref:hypothetical protein n=1 Tax=uncultured Mailhella sp. TaxID=1981031 RepID=UPI0026299D8C|nr:hypothetical protein [uncultured Mailhella sp.]
MKVFKSKVFLMFILFALLFVNYNYGIFVDSRGHFKSFQIDSERLVLSSILREKNNIKSKYGLCHFYTSDYNNYTYKTLLTNSEYYKNINRHKNMFIVSKNNYTENIYKENNVVGFMNGDLFNIIKVNTYKDHFIEIVLDNEKKLSVEKHSPVSKIKVYDSHGNLLPFYSVAPYLSQFGLQGFLFSSILKNISEKEAIQIMHVVCSFFTSLVLLLISIFIYKKYNFLMSASFYSVFLLSPWIVAFARNAYWVEFTWFMPVLLGLMCSIYKTKTANILCIFSIFLFIFIKCLCGYEYISTIMMTTVSFLFFDLCSAMVKKDKSGLIRNIKLLSCVSIACLAGFIVAICIHAYLRGDGNIMVGLGNIYKQDALRRLSGDPLNFPSLAQSLSASVGTVLTRYFKFSTSVLFGLSRSTFFILISLPIAIFIYKVKHKEGIFFDIVMYLFFFMSSISWFVIAKAHSYVHTHMNYVLWYFGFIQICIYIIAKDRYIIYKFLYYIKSKIIGYLS